MLQVTQSNTPASNEVGFLNRKWKLILLFFAKHSFESDLEGILSAAAGHEGNSLPEGNQQYQLLSTEADSLCTEFANRWGLDIELLKARIAGLAKLKRLSIRPQTISYGRLACLALIAIPALCFLIGTVGGLISVGFHFVGGR
jgi:hypothetical protein